MRWMSVLALMACVPEPVKVFEEVVEVDSDVEVDTVVDTDEEPVVEEGPDYSASSRGQRFWVGFMDNINPSFNGDPQFSLVISADADTTGRVMFPRLGREQAFSVDADRATEVFLPAANPLVRGSDVTSDFGLLVEADNDVSVAAVHYRIYFTDATSLLPEDELGSDYTVLAVQDLTGGSPSEMMVVATVDDTLLTIIPSEETVDGRPADVSFEVTLAAGQAYQLQAMADLTGTRVRTDPDTPVAVFGGARQASVTCTGADSHVWDQVLPTSRLGTEYVVMPLGAQGGDPVVVVATENNTNLRVDCGTIIRLQAGQTWRSTVSDVTRLTSDKPIGVAQLNDSQDCNPSGVGDPSFQILSPTALTTSDRSWIALPNTSIWQSDPFLDTGGFSGPDPIGTPGLSNHWLNVLATAPVTVDGEDIVMAPLPGDRDRQWVQIPLPPGEHRVESDEPFVAHAYGFASYDAYTYHLGYDCSDCLETLQQPTSCN